MTKTLTVTETKIMNHMKQIAYILLIVASIFAGCSTDEIEKWNNNTALIWFTDTLSDFTFMSTNTPVGESYLVSIPLTTAAVVSGRDREVNVEVSSGPLDARTKFEVQKPVLFRAGHTVDTMFVRVYNDSHLTTTHDTLIFKIQPSADFTPGLNGYLTTKLSIFNGLPKPSWWNVNMDYYLGYFTQLKMQIYLIVTGGDETPLDEDGYQGNQFQYIRYLLNDYVKRNHITYPEGDEHAGEMPSFSRTSY